MEEQTPYINLEEGLKRVRGNKALYARMLSLFLANKEMEMLEEKLAGGDLEGAAAVAHAIKGMTGNLSLTALFTASTALLESLGAGRREEDQLARYREAAQKTLEAAKALEAELKG